MKIIIPIIVILLFAISGCYYDSKEYLYPQIESLCDTTNITYSVSVRTVLEGYCIGCHSNNAAASSGGSIKLQDYNDVKIYAINGKLLGTISHSSGFSPMPKGSAQLESCKITIVKKWITAGEPNN